MWGLSSATEASPIKPSGLADWARRGAAEASLPNPKHLETLALVATRPPLLLLLQLKSTDPLVRREHSFQMSLFTYTEAASLLKRYTYLVSCWL